MKKVFDGVYRVNRGIGTLNSTPGFRVYGEKLVRRGGKEYRIWDPYRSKLGAAIMKKIKHFPITGESEILYLGASSGTTASHIADIAKVVYCVEFSKRMMRELIMVAVERNNMVPILGDARRPKEYSHNMGKVDFIFQDVAQKNQAEILLANLDEFNPKHAMLSIKSRSIDAVRSPKEVFRAEIDKLKQRCNILEIIDLHPYEEDHVLVNLERKV